MTGEKDKTEKQIVQTRYFDFDRLELVSGKILSPVKIAYETYGELNSSADNAVLVLHAFSGDAHSAAYHEGDEKPGWWDNMIGPGKALDTERYFIVSSNVVGGCAGSTGPSSISEESGREYALDFPFITIADMVTAQKKLLDHLKVRKLLTVIGGSMGGMQVLQWVALYPEFLKSAIPVATAMKHSPQQIAFNEVGRQAIMADPNWNDGEYYGKLFPDKGLAIARMIGHITYMSDESMENKFSRRLKESDFGFSFNPDFEVEGYLHYRGGNFVSRFDANSYLYITKAMDYFDLSQNKLFKNSYNPALKFLVISFKSDWLYPSYQSRAIVNSLKLKGIDTTYCEIESTYGHDAFLLEIDEQTRLIKFFLRKIASNED